MKNVLNLICMILFLLPVLAFGDNFSTEEFDTLVKNKDWQKAEALLEPKINDALSQVTPITGLFYNYAVVQQQQGKFGVARAFFLKTLSQNPIDFETSNLISSLDTRVSLIARDSIPENWFGFTPQILFFVHTSVWIFCALISFVLVFAKLNGYLTNLNPYFLYTLALVLFTISVSLIWQNRSPIAVVKESVVLKSGPDNSFPDLKPIEPGALVQIGEIQNSWAQLRFKYQDNVTVGWCELSKIITLK